MHFRRMMTAAALAAMFCLTAWVAVRAQNENQDADKGLLAFLNQSVDWYRKVQTPGQQIFDSGDQVYAAYNQSASQEALTLIFEYGRAQAALLQLEHPQNAANGAAGADSAQQAAERLAAALTKAQQRQQQSRNDLNALLQKAANASGKKRATLDDQIAEQKSELALADARLEAIRNMSAFATNGAASGLLGKITELQRTVPEIRMALRTARPARSERSIGLKEQKEKNALLKDDAQKDDPRKDVAQKARAKEITTGGSGDASGGTSSNDASANETAANGPAASDTTSPDAASAAKSAASEPAMAIAMPTAAVVPPAPQPVRQQATGMMGLASELFALTGEISAQRSASAATAELRTQLDSVRQPLRQRLRDVVKQGDALSDAPESNSPAELAARKQQVEALTVEFRRLSGVMLPLGKASMLLDATNSNMAEWRGRTERMYRSAGRALLLRAGALLIVLVLIGVASDFWRRAIFRYIREKRRRNQFMLLRRVVVAVVVLLVLIVSLSTEIGSLATFAGFLTAGIAVALQNIILSVAAYFLLIGRYGIKVGDRVQIGEVTGDVVDIGLVRLHLLELDTSGGEARPTGRSVVFSNAVVFQPTSNFFKQLPDSDFAWRRITLTLAADVDYALAEKNISDAVKQVYSSYQGELGRQHRQLENTLSIHMGATEPQTRLRLTSGGLEIAILYPVVLSDAAAIDDRMTLALLKTIENEPGLRLVGGGLAAIKPEDATPRPAPHLPVKEG